MKNRRNKFVLCCVLALMFSWTRAGADTVTEPIHTFEHFSDIYSVAVSPFANDVYSVAFSPDGKTFLSGTFGEMILWNVATKEKIRHFVKHESISSVITRIGRVMSVAFSPDGQRALSGNSDSTIKLWELSTGQFIHTFEGHSDDVNSVAFSPDGQKVLSGSDDKTIKLWDLSTGDLIRTLRGHLNEVRSVAFSPDGQKILSGGKFDNAVRLWDVNTGELIRNFEGHSNSVFSVAFSPDGQRALSGGYGIDGYTMKLWDPSTGYSPLNIFEGHSYDVNSVAFSPDGQIVLSGSADNTIKLWDLSTGKLIRTFEGHSNDVNSVAFSPDGQTFLSGSADKTIKLWDTGLSLNDSMTTTTYTVTVNTTGTGSGTVDGGGTFTNGTSVTLTATPNESSVFVGWTPASCGSTFELTSDITCTAEFAEIPSTPLNKLRPPDEVFNEASYFVYRPKKIDEDLLWVSYVGGWQHAGMYAGWKDGKVYIVHATGEPNVPPTFEPLDDFLQRISGTVSEMVWLAPTEDFLTSKVANLVWVIKDSPFYYPEVDYQIAKELKKIPQLEIIKAVFTKEGPTWEKIRLFIDSWGAKNPFEEGESTVTLYCSQLVYLAFKYAVGIDLDYPETKQLLNLIDLQNEIVTPADLTHPENKKILHYFKDNNIGVPEVNVELYTQTRSKVQDVNITWSLQGEVPEDGWDVYLTDLTNSTQYTTSLAATESNLYIPELSPSNYEVFVVAHGNNGPLLYPDRYERVSFVVGTTSLEDSSPPTISNVRVSPTTVRAGDILDLTWQSNNQKWFFVYLYDTKCGAQDFQTTPWLTDPDFIPCSEPNKPVNTSNFLSNKCKTAQEQTGIDTAQQGCLWQEHDNESAKNQFSSWIVPSQLPAGLYRIKVAIWNDENKDHAVGAFSNPFVVK